MTSLLRALVLAALVAVVFVALGAHATKSVATASYPCVGPPADYISAFDTVRGQPADGAVTYPYKTEFIEWQGWLTPNDGVSIPGHHSEHIHEAACIPEGQVIDDSVFPWFLDAKYTFHNVVNYTVTSSAATQITENGSFTLFRADAGQVSALNTAMQASGGLNTVTTFQSYSSPASTSLINQGNGYKELRWQIQVDRANSSALVDQWKVSARAYFDQEYAGKTATPPLGASGNCHVDFVRTQNWISFHDQTGAVKNTYGYAGFRESMFNPDCTAPAAFMPDALAQPRPDTWNTSTRITDGTSRLFVFVDPNFHAHPDTYAWVQDLGNPQFTGVSNQGGYDNAVSVPLSTLGLASGVHRFMVQGHKGYTGTISDPNQPISSPIVVMPFFYGDSQAPTAPSGLAKANPQPSSIDVSWNASTDNTGVAGYHVFLDGAQVADVSGTSATVTGLSAPSHTIAVEAYDAAGNVSQRTTITVIRTWQ